MKKKNKPKKKKCQNCSALVPKNKWKTGLCEDCMYEYRELGMIIQCYER